MAMSYMCCVIRTTEYSSLSTGTSEGEFQPQRLFCSTMAREITWPSLSARSMSRHSAFSPIWLRLPFHKHAELFRCQLHDIAVVPGVSPDDVFDIRPERLVAVLATTCQHRVGVQCLER